MKDEWLEKLIEKIKQKKIGWKNPFSIDQIITDVIRSFIQKNKLVLITKEEYENLKKEA